MLWSLVMFVIYLISYRDWWYNILHRKRTVVSLVICLLTGITSSSIPADDSWYSSLDSMLKCYLPSAWLCHLVQLCLTFVATGFQTTKPAQVLYIFVFAFKVKRPVLFLATTLSSNVTGLQHIFGLFWLSECETGVCVCVGPLIILLHWPCASLTRGFILELVYFVLYIIFIPQTPSIVEYI